MEKTIRITGMSCMHCVNAVKQLLDEVEGVEQVKIELTTGEAMVNFDTRRTQMETIIDRVNGSGIYKATTK